MLETLNKLVARYLKENGIKNTFFADYIGEYNTVVSKWLKGKCEINKDKYVLIHKFLNESHKPVNDILKEE